MAIVHFSDLGKLYADYLAATTIEGMNFVLDRQVVCAFLKVHRQLFLMSELSINSSFHLIHIPAKSNHPMSCFATKVTAFGT